MARNAFRLRLSALSRANASFPRRWCTFRDHLGLIGKQTSTPPKIKGLLPQATGLILCPPGCVQLLNDGTDGRVEVCAASGLDTRNGHATWGRAHAGTGSRMLLALLPERAAGMVLALTMGMAGSGGGQGGRQSQFTHSRHAPIAVNYRSRCRKFPSRRLAGAISPASITPWTAPCPAR